MSRVVDRNELSDESSNIKVCVRVRPFNKREKREKSNMIIQMHNDTTFITSPQTLGTPNPHVTSFTYDHSFWSFKGSGNETFDSEPFVTQKDIYEKVGVPILKSVIDGFHACVISYGQTSSGKTYTIMGGNSEETRGLIPRICLGLFSQTERMKTQFQVEISYYEIYAEKINDLINPENKKVLRVREDPTTGPYVDDLTIIPVDNFATINQFIMFGNRHRVTAATKMNDTSSRSHAVFTIYLNQVDPVTQEQICASKLCIVDLAGSERTKDSEVTGIHLREAADINTSLTVLGRVISILSKPHVKSSSSSSSSSSSFHSQSFHSSSSSSSFHSQPQSQSFVPFRDSVLTWLLKDNLGGNSKTVMLAAISPSDLNYDETLNTLQYAARTKQIVNKTSVNSMRKDVVIKKLQSDIDELKKKLAEIQNSKVYNKTTTTTRDIRDEIESKQSSLQRLSNSWAARIEATKKLQFETIGKYAQQMKVVKSSLQDHMLINISKKISFETELLHHIAVNIELNGLTISPHMTCTFVRDEEGTYLVPFIDSEVQVNDIHIDERQLLEHLDCISTDGGNVVLKYKIPICAIK